MTGQSYPACQFDTHKKKQQMKIFLQKLCLAAGFLILLNGNARAQHEAMYSQYMFNGLILNPAYAGSTGSLSAAALYRRQWLGMEGAPITQTVTLHAPVAHNKVGLGFSLINDKIGVTRNLGLTGIYAYRILTQKGAFSMGLQYGVSQYFADYTQVQTNPNNSQDNTFNDIQNILLFNVGTGLYYHTDKFYAGASLPVLYSNKIAGLGESVATNPKKYRHYFFTTGYVFTLSDHLKIKPSTLVKIAEGAPVQVDINTNLWMYNVLGVGLSYRTNDALVGMFEVQLAKQFRFSYAYDHPISQLRSFTSSSHEIMIRFDRLKPSAPYISPRFF